MKQVSEDGLAIPITNKHYICNLHKDCEHPFIDYQGPDNPDVLVVGSHPSNIDDMTGRVFSGPDGTFLFKVIEHIFGRYAHRVGYLYVVRCKPENGEVKQQQFTSCKEFFYEALAELKPRVIIPLNQWPLKALINKNAISTYRGQIIPTEYGAVVPSYSPQYIMMKEWLQGVFCEDLSKALKFLVDPQSSTVHTGYDIAATREDVEVLMNFIAGMTRVSFDIETSGLLLDDDLRIGTIAFSWAPGEAACVPLDHGGSTIVMSQEEKKELLERVLMNPNIMKIAHNIKFEMTVLKHVLDVDICPPYADTMLMHYTIDENRGGHGLKALAWEYTPNLAGYERQLEGALKEDPYHNYLNQPLSILGKYNCGDVDVTRRLYDIFLENKEFKESKDIYDNITMRIVKPLAKMEVNGVRFDVERLQAYMAEQDAYIASKMEELRRDSNVARAVVKINKDKKPEDPDTEFNIQSNDHLRILLFDVCRLKSGKKTEKTGLKSTDKEVLKRLAAQNPTAALVNELKRAMDTKSKYLTPLLELARKYRGFVKTNYSIHGTVTGRLCIAEGSLIDTPRNLNRHPGGIPIENIKEGDYVYSYDADDNLCLKKVKWVGYTGDKDVIKITWRSSGNPDKTGELILTANHEVRLFNGKWRRAGKLKEGDRLTALSRSTTCGYSRLHGRHNAQPRENKFIAQQLFDMKDGQHCHHVNQNRLDNTLSNLQVMTPREHYYEHLPSEEDLIKRARYLHTPEAKKKLLDTIQRRKENGDCLRVCISKFSLLRCFAKYGGPVKVAKALDLDYSVIVDRAKRYDVDWGNIRYRYGSDGNFISRGRMKKALEEHDYSISAVTLQGNLHAGYYKVKIVAQYYQLLPINHRIINIEKIYGKKRCYDLEVEDTHCFIANEIAVHNSSSQPNLQNVSKEMQQFFVAREGNRLISVDFSTLELRIGAALSGDAGMIQGFLAGVDYHYYTYSVMFNKPIEDVTKPERKVAKGINFGIWYGQGARGLAEALNKNKENPLDPDVPVNEAQSKLDVYLRKFPGVTTYTQMIKTQLYRDGFVKSITGRKRRLPEIRSSSSEVRERTSRQAVNYTIQSPGSDMTLLSIILIDEFIEENNLQTKLVLTVHDSIVMDVPPEEEAILLPRVKQIMEVEVPFLVGLPNTVPIKVEFEAGPNWKDMEKLEVA